jgi:hypothetical protein
MKLVYDFPTANWGRYLVNPLLKKRPFGVTGQDAFRRDIGFTEPKGYAFPHADDRILVRKTLPERVQLGPNLRATSRTAVLLPH